MRFLGLIVFFIFPSIVLTNQVIDMICDSNFTTYNTDATALDTLSKWCSEDPRCSYFFKQTEGAVNATIFNFLAYPIYKQEGGDLFLPVRNLLCGNSEPLEVVKNIWVLLLVAGQMDNKPQCGAGQSLVLNENSVVMECVYNMDTYPSTPDNEYAFFLTIVIIICVFVLLCCLVNMVKAASVFRFLKNLSI